MRHGLYGGDRLIIQRQVGTSCRSATSEPTSLPRANAQPHGARPSTRDEYPCDEPATWTAHRTLPSCDERRLQHDAASLRPPTLDASEARRLSWPEADRTPAPSRPSPELPGSASARPRHSPSCVGTWRCDATPHPRSAVRRFAAIWKNQKALADHPPKLAWAQLTGSARQNRASDSSNRFRRRSVARHHRDITPQ